jgi:hypothetical protein
MNSLNAFFIVAQLNCFPILTEVSGEDGAEPNQAPAPSKTEKSAKATQRANNRLVPPQDGPARAGNTRTRGDGGVGGNEAGRFQCFLIMSKSASLLHQPHALATWI